MNTLKNVVVFQLGGVIQNLLETYSKDYPLMTFKDCKIDDNDNLQISFTYLKLVSNDTVDDFYDFVKSNNFNKSFEDWKNDK